MHEQVNFKQPIETMINLSRVSQHVLRDVTEFSFEAFLVSTMVERSMIFKISISIIDNPLNDDLGMS